MLLLLCCGLGISGCYLTHVASGQLRLLRARQPIEAVLADPATPPDLRHQLELVERTREFAADLGLEVDRQYTSYAAWPGDRIVTSLVATRPGEVEPAGFWFPILGRLPYKGYFDPEKATAEGTAEFRFRLPAQFVGREQDNGNARFMLVATVTDSSHVPPFEWR